MTFVALNHFQVKKVVYMVGRRKGITWEMNLIDWFGSDSPIERIVFSLDPHPNDAHSEPIEISVKGTV